MRLTPFNQGDLLKGVNHPDLRGGICVALCDHWLALMRDSRARTPEERMDLLKQRSGAAMEYQFFYSGWRQDTGREEARARMGQRLGHSFEGQTRIMRAFVGFDGMVERMERDLAEPGAAVTWTMALPGMGRHAIAGYHSKESITTNIHRFARHLFDPNVGEIVGNPQEMRAMVRELFRLVPDYNCITELDRTTAE